MAYNPNKVDIAIEESRAQGICTKVNDTLTGKSTRVPVVYGFNTTDASRGMTFISQMESNKPTMVSREPLVVCGDFNFVLLNEDRLHLAKNK